MKTQLSLISLVLNAFKCLLRSQKIKRRQISANANSHILTASGSDVAGEWGWGGVTGRRFSRGSLYLIWQFPRCTGPLRHCVPLSVPLSACPPWEASKIDQFPPRMRFIAGRSRTDSVFRNPESLLAKLLWWATGEIQYNDGWGREKSLAKTFL